VAPILAAVLMWVFTRSPFVLAFAVLGPVVALAAMGDARRRARADLRRHLARYEQEFAAARQAIDIAHDHERAELARSLSCPSALVASEVRDSERWRIAVGEHLAIQLGIGRVCSTVVLDDDSPIATGALAAPDGGGAPKGQSWRSVDELRHHARVVERAPIVIDARLGIGVCGSRVEGTALATSIAVQLAAALSPGEVGIDVASDKGGIFRWTQSLPHNSAKFWPDKPLRRGHSGSGNAAELSFLPHSNGAPVILCVADDERSLPRECRVVVAVVGSQARIVRHPDTQPMEAFVPEYISHRQAQRFAETLVRAARSSFTHWGKALPEQVALSELLDAGHIDRRERGSDLRQGECGGRNSLAVTVGIGVSGHVTIDLVNDGPHAIVGGTTGSGKSEVLVTWVLALAAEYSPADVNFLLIDFKGGAAFAPVQGLPHTVGVLTDLEPSTARRAILSLRAELLRRERILSEAKVRSIAELPCRIELPRLLIIVDEFAAMASSFAELHDLFADLAARGRSLGIHLILCTQRPAGTIRDSVFANCTLRLSLRVNNAADSTAVVGTPDAAGISRNFPGRGFLLREGTEVESVQWAMSNGVDAEGIAALSLAHTTPIYRPWLDPLPQVLGRTAVPAALLPAITFGLADIPEEQRQEPAQYDRIKDGNLFIVGSHHSGKSTTLASLAASANHTVTVPSNVEGAWDTVTDLLAAVRAGTSPSLILLDDLDLIMDRFGPEYESAFADRVMSLAREGPKAGTAVVVTASTLRARVQAVSALCASTLVLRMRDRQDHVLVGGEAAEFSSQLPPGGGYWRGHQVQVCFSEPLLSPLPEAAPPLEGSFGDSLIVVSAHPAGVLNRLEKLGKVTTLDAGRPRQEDLIRLTDLSVDRGSRPMIILGDPDAWLSSSALLSSLRSRIPLVFHECSLTEFRSLARTRELPPPLDSPHDTVVLLHPDGRMHRAFLPTRT
jgi:S-DNA-T family DNA segregation ATPase FtsK/SpoIIIE